MTNIPSVEKRVDKVFQEVMADIGKHYKVSDRLSDILSDSLGERLTQTLTADCTTLLNELLETSRERQKGWISKDGSDRHPKYDEHDWFQAHLDELINPNKDI